MTFTLFRERGFSSTSMLQIVTRARVSKRDLYALFNNKHAVLAAAISERAQQMRRPLDPATPAPQTRDALATLLVEFGVSHLKTVCHPEVLTVFRLAIAESGFHILIQILRVSPKPTRACMIRALEPQATVRVLTLGAWRPGAKVGINYLRTFRSATPGRIYKRTSDPKHLDVP